MGRNCSVCQHGKLLAIDRALLRNEVLKAIAARYQGVSADALSRHRKHMRTAMAKAASAAERQELAYGQGLLGELESITADVQRLQLELEAGQDRKGALRAIHERLCALELRAKLTGQLEGSGRTVIVNQGLSFEEAVKLAKEICEAAGLRVVEAAPTIDADCIGRPLLEDTAQ